MKPNPFQSPSSVQQSSCPERAYSAWTNGPLIGAAIGVAYVSAMTLAWTIHGCPDFLIRGYNSAFQVSIMYAIGGAIVGVPYAVLVYFTSKILGRRIQALWHFVIGIVASFAISYLNSELSLQSQAVSLPFVSLASIVAVTFAGAIASSSRPDRVYDDDVIRS